MDTEQVIKLLSTGKTTEAVSLVKAQLCSTPEDPKTVYAMGLCELMTNNPQGAIPWLRQAYEHGHTDPACSTNLGVAYLQSDHPEEAKFYFLEALKKDPNANLARYNLGTLYISTQQAQAAATEFKNLVQRFPENTEYLCALADAKREAGQFEVAIALYNKVLTLTPTHHRALTNTIKLHLSGGLVEKAITLCEAALAQDPTYCDAHHYLGDCLAAREDYEAAMTAYADAYDLDKTNTELCCAIGNMWLQAKEMTEAASWYDAAIQIDADNYAAQCGLIHIIKEMGDIDQAISNITPLLASQPSNDTVLLTAADIYWEDGDADTAIAHLETLTKLKPHKTQAILKMGQILASSGKIDKAIEHYHRVLAQFPNNIAALCGLATGEKEKTAQAIIDRMLQLREASVLVDSARGQLSFGLTHYYDGKQDSARAAAYSRDANKYQWLTNSKIRWQYDPQTFEDHISALIDVFSPAYFENLANNGIGSADETPVFIVAMPRSGTTLTEQILARHSQVLGIGERGFATRSFNTYLNAPAFSGANKANTDDTPDQKMARAFSQLNPKTIAHFSQAYLTQLNRLREKSAGERSDGKASAANPIIRVVDKMPDNYSLLGWILTLFPKARIIHCHRDPRDVALSCWMTQFGAIPWANNTDHLIHRIEQYNRIMNHWREVIPDRFMELEYADLVREQESQSQALIKYLGLTWEPQCLKFYESDRLVRTASITQVRQPIHTKSVNKWQRYHPYLSDLITPLDPKPSAR